MKLAKLFSDRFKDWPQDAQIKSHGLSLRGGYIKHVASGIFSLYPPMRRVTRKIEAIIREEMDKIDGQEVLFPVALPASLWEESGRYESVGAELLRFRDRNSSSMVLGMTHEEAAVHLAREYGESHLRYPFMIYQIQTKFRDEKRPRGGLIRVREFTMKDAYSFHTSQTDLEEYYARCHQAYENIFRRVGLKNVISVASDSGMMGGQLSHEFMLLTPVGEDTLAICPHCGYSANMEAAPNITRAAAQKESALALVPTPEMKTIEEVCQFLKKDEASSVKAVVYQRNADDSFVIGFLRGDLEVNEAKLTKHLGCEVHPAIITENCGLCAGFIGPYGLNESITALYDLSLESACDLVAGGNQTDAHYTGLCMQRDVPKAVYGDFSKITQGGICPSCGKESIELKRGIEIGNIFQLGDKYTKAMDMRYTDKDGALQTPIMGCYGIGVGRLAASVMEESNDDNGPIWPLAIAPWQVHLTCLRPDDEATHAAADALYESLTAKGIEVLYDDRPVSAGIAFSDADLLGIPLRVILSPRNLKEGLIEIVTRDKRVQLKLPLADATESIIKLLGEM